MFGASKNLALKCQPSFFSVNFLDMDGIINQYTIWCFVGKQGKSEGFESCDRPIVRKRPILVKIGDFLSRVTLKFDG